LSLATGAVDAVKDLADAPSFLDGGFPQELGPAVLAEQPLWMWVVSVNLKKDLSARLQAGA
jgi:hypothetical protein